MAKIIQPKPKQEKEQNLLANTRCHGPHTLLGFGYTPESEEGAEKLVIKLDEWSRCSCALRTFDFCDWIGIHSIEFDRFCTNHKAVYAMRETAKSRIGSRRESLAIFNPEVNANALLKPIRIYNEDYRQIYNEERDDKVKLNSPVVQENVKVVVKWENKPDSDNKVNEK